MKTHYFIMLIVGVAALYSSCLPPQPGGKADSSLYISPDFKDARMQLIYTYRDKQDIDSLSVFTQHPNESYRYFAAQAFGSIQRKEALPFLTPMLSDSSIAVRRMAAFAIGQLRDVRGEKALTDAFINQDTFSGFDILNATILEALGKCGSTATLKLIAETSTYMATDTALLMGQMHALYQFGLRNLHHISATNRAVDLLLSPNVAEEVKLICGQYLHRFNVPGLEKHANALYNLVSDGKTLSSHLEMTLIPVILKSEHDSRVNLALDIITDPKKDYRVRVNTIRALSHLPNDKSLEIVKRALLDKDPFVSQVAAQHLIEFGQDNQGMAYFALIDSIPEHLWETRILLAGAAGRHLSPYRRYEHQRISTYLTKLLSSEENPAKKRLITEMLGNCFNCLVPLKNMLEDKDLPLYIRSTAAEAFGQIATLKNFDAYYGYASTDVKVYIGKYLSLALLSPSDSLVAPAASALIHPKAGLRLYVPDTINFDRLMDSLNPVAQAEDYIQLLKLQAFAQNKSTDILWTPPFNKPMDWVAMEELSDTVHIALETEHGVVDLALYTHQAPATVLSLYELIANDWYNGKSIHRVVPNFVIQGGCTRGDGYGSLPYTISSEHGFDRFDKEGIVGIASAGPYTESQQFFITHSATPHLNGRYTICGEVIDGIDVIHRIRRGDVIKSISIKPSPTNL